MTCPECGGRLQQWLDSRTCDAFPGEPLVLCPACAEWADAARRLDRGLGRMTRPMPPPFLADRIVAGVAARQRRRFRLWLGVGVSAATAAAALLIAVWPLLHRADPAPVAAPPRPITQAPTPQPSPAAPVEAHATLRESVAQAGSAVASLTSRTADQTVAKTKLLFPAVDPSLAKLDLQPPLDAPNLPLREAGEGVSSGLEPVADSAKRAVGLFLRELPPMEGSPKGGL
ncbi:MAG TPA: hypothetical protein VMS17_07640 [Gemmataceae bacterium]|nr:hypothetical protein [Gemmataceae bacterium]